MNNLSALPNGAEMPDIPLKILLVDDEPSTLQLVRKVLQADGHEIHEAVDGLQAIEVFEKERPDLVLLDIVIPQMDGLDVLREIRKQDKITGVIMVSALSSEQLAVKSMLAGADDYVRKPFKLRNIRLNIRRVMDKVRLRRRNAELQAEVNAANRKLQKLFELYMDPKLADKLMESPDLPELGGERQIITIMFMDFCNFTPLSHELPPVEVVRILNEYFAQVASEVHAWSGYLDKIMGDGFMAIFTMDEKDDHATRAVLSAIEMQRRVADWNIENDRPLQMRIGLNTGEAVVGNIGTKEFMNYTAIGDAVNLAKRLEESGEAGDIQLSNTTYSLLNHNQLADAGISVVCAGEKLLKGLDSSIEIYHATKP